MNVTSGSRGVLFIAGLVAMIVGGSLLIIPEVVFASNGLVLDPEVSLRSEIRAPGGALLALGGLVTAGGFTPRLARTAALVSTLLYLSYGSARVLAMLMDGRPASGLVVAMGLEFVIGVASAWTWWRSHRDGARRIHRR